MIDRKTKLDFGIPFMWLIRFALYIRTANRAETKIALRKLGMICLFFFPSFAYWFFLLGSGGVVLSTVFYFWITIYTAGIIANFYSRNHFTQETWEHLFHTSQRIPFIHVPDLREVIIAKSFKTFRRFSKENRLTLNEFPIGWAVYQDKNGQKKKYGWIWYGFRRPYDPPEVYRHHIAFTGELDVGIDAMRDVIAMNAFMVSHDNLFIILDSDAGGINFDMYKDMWGFWIYRTHTDCMKAIHYVNQELLKRRKEGTKHCTQIIVMADHKSSAAFIGRSPGTRHYKPVMGAIQNIVSMGKQFGIHLVLFPPPDFHENSVTNYVRHEFSRHYLKFCQHHSNEFTEIKTPDGKTIGFRAIDAPPWGIGDFYWTQNGIQLLVKSAPPKPAQVMHRIKQSLLYYPQHAKALWEKFRYLDFPEYSALELEQKVEEQPVEQSKEKPRRECPVCSGRGRMLKVTIDTTSRIVRFNCLKIKGGCGHKWEQHIDDGVTLDISEGVSIGGNGKSGIGEEIIHKPPNFTEDYHYKS